MTSSPVAKQNHLDLPQEIWWVVMQELSARTDHHSLFLCSKVSRGFATLALPLLYSISEHSKASASSAGSEVVSENLRSSVVFWRSVISSAIGKTRFPYCTWIKTLKLSDLLCLLEDIGRDAAMRAKFFSSPLEGFEVLNPRRRQGLDFDQIIATAAEKVTERIRASADAEDRVAGLLNLEGPHLPTTQLSAWLARLPMLTSLSVRDGSVLTAAVGEAIKGGCPGFKELTCYYCRGTGADDAMAGFFNALRPNALESFTVNSLNDLRDRCFTALGSHAQSLRCLELESLEQLGLESVHLIGPCPKLKRLTLEADSVVYRGSRWTNLDEAVVWLQQCPSLEEFSSIKIPLVQPFLERAIEAGNFQLKRLRVFGPCDEGLFSALEIHQKKIQSLILHTTMEDIDEEDALDTDKHQALFNLMLSLGSNLNHLVVDEPITYDEFQALFYGMFNIEILVINPYPFHDSYFQHLASLPKLKFLAITSQTDITFEQMTWFLDRLEGTEYNDNGIELPPPDHKQIAIQLNNQEYGSSFTEEEYEELQERLKSRWGGWLTVNYMGDPDELHESDFSD
ncbi:hypothetical protein OQA88_578 [Cercophora sp. LCS_1]